MTWFATAVGTGPIRLAKLEATHHSYSSVMYPDWAHLLHYALARSQAKVRVNHELLFSIRGMCAGFVPKIVKFNTQAQITNCQPWQFVGTFDFLGLPRPRKSKVQYTKT